MQHAACACGRVLALAARQVAPHSLQLAVGDLALQHALDVMSAQAPLRQLRQDPTLLWRWVRPRPPCRMS
jgi:hypothetical protein